MDRLTSFQEKYTCNDRLIQIGDEYKVYDINEDPYYKHFSEEYKDYLQQKSVKATEFNDKYRSFTHVITEYFQGEYTETTDQQFQDVGETFFERGYGDDVYVCYSEEVLEQEKKSWENRLDINGDKCHATNPYRLFKLVKRVDKDIHIYSSVYTGLTYEIDTRLIPMVWASCNEGGNYRSGSWILKEFIAAEQLFIQTQRLTGKRIMREIKNRDTTQREDLDLDCVSTVFNVDAMEAAMKNKYTPFDACHPEIPKGIWDNILNWFMTHAGYLGFIQNMNDKKERLTTGENFKDLHAVTNIEYRNLKRLNMFGRQFAEKYPGRELNFNLSNGGDAQGVPEGEFGGEELDNVENNSKGDEI